MTRHIPDDLRGQKIIDSRDVIARIDHLESEIASQRDDPEAYPDGPDEELTEELKVLKELQDEAEGYCPDWHHGATLISDDHFTEYAQELAEDIGAIKDNAGWPYDFIDWDAAAEALKMDYTQVVFDGTDYWVR